MDEQELWMPGDDEAIRGALDTLRLETEALPLADVRFVKARGNARRRRTLIVGAASAAAAVVAIGLVAANTLGSNRALDVGPAATSPTSASTSPPRHAVARRSAAGLGRMVGRPWHRRDGPDHGHAPW